MITERIAAAKEAAVFYTNVAANIRRTGRSIVAVFGTDDDMPFAYSIGNSLKGVPEVLIFGLRPEDAHGVINHVSSMPELAVAKDGDVINLGGAFGLKVVIGGAQMREDYTIQAGRYLRREDYPVVQLLAPDKQGRYPGDPACDPPYSNVPILRPT